MGFIKNIWNKLTEQKPIEEEYIDDNETKDKYLRSLRRERRIQMEEVEKEQLKKDIESYKKDMLRRHMFGIKPEDEVYLRKRLDLLKERTNILQTKYMLRQQPLKDYCNPLGSCGFRYKPIRGRLR